LRFGKEIDEGFVKFYSACSIESSRFSTLEDLGSSHLFSSSKLAIDMVLYRASRFVCTASRRVCTVLKRTNSSLITKALYVTAEVRQYHVTYAHTTLFGGKKLVIFYTCGNWHYTHLNNPHSSTCRLLPSIPIPSCQISKNYTLLIKLNHELYSSVTVLKKPS